MILSDNAIEVLHYRYLQNGESPDDMFRRVAKAVASVEEKDKSMWEEKFYDMMFNLDFLPGTPTLINAGRSLGQLSACFVVPVEDSIPEIFEAIKQAAMIHKSGGGTGFSFSHLRPAGAKVKETGGIASGPISFMRIFNSATSEMKQGGVRRGANMGILRIDHPDILKFISCKRHEGTFENFNISVAVTDEFMDCLNEGVPFDLHFKGKVYGSIDPESLWEEICRGAWKNGEPGLFFIDRVNQDNPFRDTDYIDATNPCAEQPLPPYGSCNLGSINLGNFVSRTKRILNTKKFNYTVQLAVRFLDNVIDVTTYPLPEIEKESKKVRRIGLGIMGLADMLIKMHLVYHSKSGITAATEVMELMREVSHKESYTLGNQKGIPQALLDKGISRRNFTLTTIAPTGSLSLIANCSSGCEPVFAFEYTKKCIESEIEIVHPLVEEWREKHPNKGLPDYFVTARDIPVLDHIRMQSGLQKYTDSGISKTINAPESTIVSDVKVAFKYAYDTECKSITFYREGSRKLESQVSKVRKPTFTPSTPVLNRPRQLDGTTTDIKTGRGKLYVTVNELENKPYEIFMQIGKSGREDFAYSEAIGRLISLGLKSGVPIEKIISHLQNISGHEQVYDYGRLIKSVPDALAVVLKQMYTKEEGGIPKTKEVDDSIVCPDCEDVNVVIQSNCATCMSCGWSKC